MAQRFKPVDLTSEDDEEEETTEIECGQSQFAANGNVTATSFLDKVHFFARICCGGRFSFSILAQN